MSRARRNAPLTFSCIVLLWGAHVPQTRAAEPHARQTEAAVNRSRGPADEPPVPRRSPALALRLGTAFVPMAMLTTGVPAPFLVGGVSLRWSWFELGIEAMAMTWDLGTRDTLLAFNVGAYGHSLRRSRVRLRHGLKLGVATTISFRRHVGPFSSFPMPTLSANLLGVLVRLSRHLWLEIEPLTTGFPSVYEASLALRWEG